MGRFLFILGDAKVGIYGLYVRAKDLYLNWPSRCSLVAYWRGKWLYASYGLRRQPITYGSLGLDYERAKEDRKFY